MLSFVGAVLRHTTVELGYEGIASIDLTATDSVWTTVDSLPPQFGGLHIFISDRTAPSHISVNRCRFDGQVAPPVFSNL